MKKFIIYCVESEQYFVEYKGNFELVESKEKVKAKRFDDPMEASELADQLHDFNGYKYDVKSVTELQPTK